MPIILYRIRSSGPSRSVIMAAQHMGIQLELRQVDLLGGEHMKPAFLAMNPQHTVPTIDDNGFYLWDSHVIITYLANKYAPENPIYPKDPQRRAVVDRLLYFDIGTFCKAYLDYVSPMLFEGLPPVPEKEDALKKALQLLENFLEKTTYVAGDHLTLADFSIVANLGSIAEVGQYCLDPYPRVTAYLERMKAEIPNYKEINDIPLKNVREHLKYKKK